MTKNTLQLYKYNICIMENTEKVYRLTADYKKSTYQAEHWTNVLSNGKRVTVVVTTYFWWGTFEVTLNNKEKEELLKKEQIVLNDYSCCCEELEEGCDRYDEIKNKSSYTDEELREIHRLIYCDQYNKENYDSEEEYSLEEDILEANGWSMDDTIYGIDSGCVLECIDAEEINEDDNESVRSGQFKCEKCEIIEEKNSCYKCAEDNICSNCYGEGGDYGPYEEWVCEECLPNCLICGSTLRQAQDECCGNSRSDMVIENSEK